MEVQANGLNFNVVVEGDGAPVLLLHGFPDSSRLWRHQVPALAGAGFRVVAPDLRGFGESDRPEEVASYALPNILGDVFGILDALGIARVQVVGHDWGAAIGWAMAIAAPERVERLVALAVGHPSGRFADGVAQRERSWYMLFFKFEGIAEAALRADDWRLLREWLRDEGDVDRYVVDLARPGALTAGLNWYRANLRPESFGSAAGPALPPAVCPVLGVWGDGDHYLTEGQMTASARFVQGGWRYERIEGAGHWLPLDAPERLNELLLSFLVPATKGP